MGIKHLKLIAALVVVVVALIVFFQNSRPVDLQVLWLAQVQTSLSTALLAAFLAGVVAGALAFSRWKHQREKARTAASPGG